MKQISNKLNQIDILKIMKFFIWYDVYSIIILF
jgi:hypothetical protein